MEITYADWRLADHRVYISNTGKFKKATKWTPKVGIEEGIDLMIEQYATRS
jgi:nucleoside-diphosphate-sugar epimerase